MKVAKRQHLSTVNETRFKTRLQYRLQCLIYDEKIEDTKGVIRIRISKKNRQHNGSTKDKQRSTKHIYKTKDRITRTALKTGGELMCSFTKCFLETRIYLLMPIGVHHVFHFSRGKRFPKNLVERE